MMIALVCGAGVDLKYPEFWETLADDFVVGDLRDHYLCRKVAEILGSRPGPFYMWTNVWMGPSD